MQVILLEKVSHLGGLGSQVNVKPGHARNFLLPYGKAVSATRENIKAFEERRVKLERKAAENLAKTQKRAEALSALRPTITVKASDEGKLYGSIGVRELAIAFTEAGVKVNKSEILRPEGPIRTTGEFEIDVKLHSDVKVSVTTNIVAA